MYISILRDDFLYDSTFGVLFINGLPFCETLEDKDRRLESGGEKIKGQSAIPRGTYECIINYSNRFRRELPLLLNVPGFEGVRIHNGNTSDDTEGCILVGSKRGTVNGKRAVTNSIATMNNLFAQMERAFDRGEKIILEVK